jgi:hypothetical protein
MLAAHTRDVPYSKLALALPLTWLWVPVIAEMNRDHSAAASKTADWIMNLVAPSLMLQAIASALIVVWLRRPSGWIVAWLVLNGLAGLNSALNMAMFSSGDWI